MILVQLIYIVSPASLDTTWATVLLDLLNYRGRCLDYYCKWRVATFSSYSGSLAQPSD